MTDAATKDPWDVPPWRRPGGFRRDPEPHRVGLLRLLLGAGCACLLAMMPAAAFLKVFVGSRLTGHVAALAPTTAGVVLCVTALVLARHDLAGMRAGEVDSRGQDGTRRVAGALALLLFCFAVAAAALLTAVAEELWGRPGK